MSVPSSAKIYEGKKKPTTQKGQANKLPWFTSNRVFPEAWLYSVLINGARQCLLSSFMITGVEAKWLHYDLSVRPCNYLPHQSGLEAWASKIRANTCGTCIALKQSNTFWTARK